MISTLPDAVHGRAPVRGTDLAADRDACRAIIRSDLHFDQFVHFCF
jgi:hypothetical protein